MTSASDQLSSFVDIEEVLQNSGVQISDEGRYELAVTTPLEFGRRGNKYIVLVSFRTDQSPKAVTDLIQTRYPQTCLAIVQLSFSPIGCA